jgi:hypothetical protein
MRACQCTTCWRVRIPSRTAAVGVDLSVCNGYLLCGHAGCALSHVCGGAGTELTRQLPHAQVLANAKLVAVCQLQHCQLTLVPYLEAGSGALRMIGFLTTDDLGGPA